MLCGVMWLDVWSSNPLLTLVHSGQALASPQLSNPFLLLPLVLSTPSCKSRIHGRKQKKALPFPLPPATGSSLHLSGPSTPQDPLSRRGHCCSLYCSALLQSMCLTIYTPQG